MRGIILLLSLLFLGVFALNLNAKSYGYGKGYGKGYGSRGVANPQNALYEKECASCHFGYQPGLLPSASWRYVMGNLANHYGTDASIDEAERAQIEAFLLQNASETSNYKRSVKITNSLQPGTLYTSLTQIPYLQKKHRKIEQNLINQKEVRSLARCAACHREAKNGEYNDKTVNIPNYGAWERRR